MKPRTVVDRCKTNDAADLENLLPLTYENSPAFISYTSGSTSGCSLVSLRGLSIILFLLLVGVIAAWFIHCAVFMNTRPVHSVIDTRLFFNVTDADIPLKIKELQDKLVPGILEKVWNNGTIDLDMMRELVAVLIDKPIKDVVIPPRVMQGFLKHIPDIVDHNYGNILADWDFVKALMEMISQKPISTISNPNQFLSGMLNNNNATAQAGALLTKLTNMTALTKTLSDSADVLQKISNTVLNNSSEKQAISTARRLSGSHHINSHHIERRLNT